MSKDYYAILGVDKTATKEEIKKAFREKAHKYHPDKQTGDEKKFKEINEAYQVLNNDQKRQQYDQFGSTFDQQGGFGGGMNWDDFMKYARGGQTYSNVNDFGDLGDILSEMFGGGFGFGGQRSQRANTRGRDLEIDLQLNFKEAIFGVEKQVELNKLNLCEKCNGNGAEPGTKIIECKRCQGQGKIKSVQNTILGAIQTVSACPDCQGQGKTFEKACTNCQGQGRIKTKKLIPVKIPAGVDNGVTLRSSGGGEAGLRGGVAGDLYIHLHVKPDDYFKRHGNDILTSVKITFSQAALGDKVLVKTIDDEVKLKIPAGVQSGKVFKLKGKGVPNFQGYGKGDHLVTINIKTPEKLTREQKNLFEELKKEGL